MTKNLSVDALKIDSGTQNRVEINEDTVEEYAELVRQSNGDWPFPPLDVFSDGSGPEHLIADGFHRLLGATRAKRGSVPCTIHKGTARDARIFGMTANDRHGMRMSRADKRACVEWLLDNGGKMTQKEIAEKAGVTPRFVKGIVADRNPASIKGKAAPPKRDGKGNRSPSTPNRGGKGGAGVTSEPRDTGADVEPEPDDDDAPTFDRRPAKKKAAAPKKPDLGKCPNCAGTKWAQDGDGWVCSKCKHPHGEPTGGADEDRVATQRSKTVKTVEALMRAFDDLQTMLAKPEHGEAIKSCKALLKMAKAWK